VVEDHDEAGDLAVADHALGVDGPIREYYPVGRGDTDRPGAENLASLS
jgi:hypothetical protein